MHQIQNSSGYSTEGTTQIIFKFLNRICLLQEWGGGGGGGGWGGGGG